MAKETAYNLVAETLREQILGGKYQPGQQLPTERELCEQFATSRITIRRAIQILEEELLVYRRQGSGTYISSQPTRKIPIINTDYFDSIARHAPQLKRRLDAHEWRAADAEVADALQILPGEQVLFARRIDHLESKPVTMDELFLPRRFASRITADDLTDLDFLERWDRAQGVVIDYSAQAIEAAPASETIAAHLQIPLAEPLLVAREVLHTVGGRIGGLIVSYYRHQYFRLHSIVRPAERAAKQGTTNEVPATVEAVQR